MASPDNSERSLENIVKSRGPKALENAYGVWELSLEMSGKPDGLNAVHLELFDREFMIDDVETFAEIYEAHH